MQENLWNVENMFSGTVDQQQNDTAAAGNEAAIHSLILNNSCQPFSLIAKPSNSEASCWQLLICNRYKQLLQLC